MTQTVAVLGTGKSARPSQRHDPAGWHPADLLVTARRPERAEELRTRYGVEPSPTRRPRSAPTP